MKYFKNLKQLKLTLIFLAMLGLISLEFFYIFILEYSLSFVLLDLVIGSLFILVATHIGFYFVAQLQAQLKQEVRQRAEIEETLLLRSQALEAAANAIVITDINGRFLWANHAFSKLTGYSEAEVLGQTPAILKSGKQDSAFYAELWQTVTAGQVWQGEIINRKKNGRLYTEEQIITPVCAEDGRVTHFIAIKQDITRRKQAEEQLEEYTERLRLIHTIDQAILSKQAPDEIAQVVLKYAFKAIPCQRASVSVIDDATFTGTIIAVMQEGETAVAPNQPFSLTNIEISYLSTPDLEFPVEIVDLSNPLSPIGKKIKAEGFKTYIKIPLVAQGKLIGFFNLGTRHKDTLTAEHMAIAEDIATSLAIALQQSRFYMRERRQRQEAEALREIGEALNSTLNVDEILNLLLGQMIRAIHYDSAHIMLIQGDNAKIHYSRGYEQYDPEIKAQITAISFTISSTPNLKWIVDHQESLIIPDVQQYSGWRKDKSISTNRSWVGVPILVDGKISVIIALAHQQPGYYQESHVNTLRAFASQVGLALENARLYEELRAYTNKLEERVQARTRALADANKRLKELDRLKTKFISDVSHELRTPITNVTMYLDLLERGHAEKHDHYMDVLKQETERLSRLIEDIFDETIYANHLRQAEYAPVDLNEIIVHAVNLHHQEAKNAGLLIKYDLEPELPLIWGESLQLGQVISNLLRNGINYAAQAEVRITTKRKKGLVTISIDDTGSGIPEEDLPYLFDRFYRGNNASQSTIPGTGLGLGIVREIVELHGGRITVANNAQGGASFHIMLPSKQLIDRSRLLDESSNPQNGAGSRR